jgi:hypothetical protein
LRRRGPLVDDAPTTSDPEVGATMEAGTHFHSDPSQMTRRPSAGAVRDAARDGTSGWIAFAGVYLIIAGGLNALWGIAALAKKEHFIEGGLVFSDLQLWGWIALIVGAVQVLTAVLVLLQNAIGMLMAIVVSMCALFANFLMFGAYPGWSALAMVCNGLVLWAVTVHSEAFES